ncbi:hypothetical protein SVAN01_00938 [Stagonosporopsis vannaccii]|nr:hypothetical protein SVAN01_00938 [Stagonosporopsis vannaccii]
MGNAKDEKTICAWDYIDDRGPTTTTVICTLLVLFFTFVLEFAVHSYMNCCNTIKDEDVYTVLGRVPDEEELLPPVVLEQPQPETAPRADVPQNDISESDAIEAQPEPAQKKPPPRPDCCTCCVRNPSPNIRANRFIAAVFLYAIILTAFSIRIDNIVNPYISPSCQRYFSNEDVAGPNWWAVGILNILPLVIASLSVLRTVIDCFLVRWGRGLKYVGQDGADDWTTWPMCMSFFLVFVCIREAARLPITLLMGVPRASLHSRRTQMAEDIEMGGEETRGLAGGVDEDSDYEGDEGGPPAYKDAIHGQQGARTGSGKAR